MAARTGPWSRLRWTLFDRSLSLDPAKLPRPVAAPGPRDFVICGAPRTGTTLLCGLLYQEPKVVTVMQPWDGLRKPIDRLFAELRKEIASGRLSSGRLDLAALRETGALVPLSTATKSFPVTVDDDYLLGVKWPVFQRYVELLPETKFLVCARHPAAVVASYTRGAANPGLRRFAKGYPNPNRFNREMVRRLRKATDDAQRRLLLFDYHYERVIPQLGRKNVMVVHHERWYTEPGALLAEIGDFLGVPLHPGHVHIEGRPPLDDPDAETILRRSLTARFLGYGTR